MSCMDAFIRLYVYAVCAYHFPCRYTEHMCETTGRIIALCMCIGFVLCTHSLTQRRFHMNISKTKRLIAAVLAALTVAGSVHTLPVVTIEAAEQTYSGAPITEHIGGYDHYDRTLVTHAYDFSVDRIGSYASDHAVGMGNRAAAEIIDGRLTVKEGMEFAFASAVGLGDDYGLEEGYLSFDLKLTGGKVLLGLRTSLNIRTADTAFKDTDRGIWFTFDGTDTMRIYEPECGLEATVDMPINIAEETKFHVHEGLDTITLSSGDTVIASIRYRTDGYLAICDKTGKVVAETTESKIYPSGYFQLTMKDTRGYIDNVIFTNVEAERKIPDATALRTIDYSTWTATDALDRTIADNEVAGDEKDNRYVGLFYFLCSVGAGLRVSDNTKDWLEYGPEGIKARIEERGGEAFWAEPYFGYYINTDTWVYRKHGYMLEQAGVDFIFLDVSNGVVFPEGHMALFDTWLEMRREGIDTPQIVFFNGDTTKFMDSNMRQLFTTVYSEENWDKYKELFFEWDGKPLIFGNMTGVGADLKGRINDTFTVRGSWAWQDKNNYWSWIQEYKGRDDRFKLENGGWGRDADGNYESLSVAMGHHPTMNKGRSFVNGREPNNGLGDFEFSSIEQAGKGLGFAFQFQAVQTLIRQNIAPEDPFVMLITGWNEWIAGGFTHENPVTLANTTCKVQYVDQFNPEFSRDGEPMRNTDGYGIGDNYYYQMVDMIRQYKGIAKTPTADRQGSINIYDLAAWDEIEMTYMDSLYDTELRNTVSYDKHFRYINNTGRNDLAEAKVSQDANAFYFLIKASHNIVIDNDADWMNLYINTDADMKTGWEGYDYVLNRDRDSFVVTVEKFINDTYETEVVGGAYYYLEGDSMAIRLSKDIIGMSGKCTEMIFKWADNAAVCGDPMAFMDLGDTAPDNRFGFRYLCDAYTTEKLPALPLASEKTTAPQNGTVIPKPDDDIDISVGDTTVDILYDFENMTPGMNITDTVMGEQFEHKIGTSQSSARISKGKDERGNYVSMKGYSDLRTWSDVEGSYEFSADVCIHAPGMSGIYIRGEMPGAYAPVNPKNHGIDQVFHYYEWDWYAENGGKTFGASSTAGSGIGIYPGESEITVRIKRYAADGLGVASASYTLPYTEDFKPSSDGWLNIRCVDDGSKVSIYFNGALMCSAKLESPGVIYKTDGTGQAYYGKVTLLDPAGTEVLVVENTRVNSTGSQLALSSRDRPMEFDNVYISYATQSTEGSRLETDLNTPPATVDYTPDDRLAKTLVLGNNTVTPDDTFDTTDTTETGSNTPPATDTTPVIPTESETVDETTPAKKKGCKSAVSLVTLPVLLAAAWYFRRRES